MSTRKTPANKARSTASSDVPNVPTSEDSQIKKELTLSHVKETLTKASTQLTTAHTRVEKAENGEVKAYIRLGKLIKESALELKPWKVRISTITQELGIPTSTSDRAIRFYKNEAKIINAKSIREADRLIAPPKKNPSPLPEEAAQPGESPEDTKTRVSDLRRSKRILAEVTKIHELKTYGPKLLQEIAHYLKEEGINIGPTELTA